MTCTFLRSKKKKKKKQLRKNGCLCLLNLKMEVNIAAPHLGPTHFLPPATKVMFLHLSVILFTGGEGCLSRGDPPLDRDTPWTKIPLDRDPPDRDLPGQRPPSGQRPPWRENPLWTETPSGQRPSLDKDHLDRDPPGQRSP